MVNYPQLQIDPQRKHSFYRKADILKLSPEEYEGWVYDQTTPRADEVRMYENYYVNYLMTKCPLWVPYLLWPPAIAYLMKNSEFNLWVFTLGILCWFPLEYYLHKFVYHLKASSSGRQKFQLTLHGVHHLAPTDLHHIVSPPHEIIIQALIIWGILKLISFPYPESLISALLIQYVRYDTFHYFAHGISYTAIARMGSLGRYIEKCKRQHMRHHYVDSRQEFAISFLTMG